MKTYNGQVTRAFYFFFFTLLVGCASKTTSNNSIPDWYGKSASNLDSFYFYGEADSLANAKLLALSDLNQQLISDVQSTVSYNVSTSNGKVAKQSHAQALSSGLKLPIPLPQWLNTRHQNKTFYVEGKLSTAKFASYLENIINDEIGSININQTEKLSISHFLHFKKNSSQARKVNSYIHLLGAICRDTCQLSKLHQWQARYDEVQVFPSQHCIRVVKSSSVELTNAVSNYFLKEGFTGNSGSCLKAKAVFTPKYLRRDNQKLAEGWLKLSIHPQDSESVSSRAFLTGKSEHSYKLAFQNSLDNLNKKGLFSSLK